MIAIKSSQISKKFNQIGKLFSNVQRRLFFYFTNLMCAGMIRAHHFHCVGVWAHVICVSISLYFFSSFLISHRHIAVEFFVEIVKKNYRIRAKQDTIDSYINMCFNVQQTVSTIYSLGISNECNYIS